MDGPCAEHATDETSVVPVGGGGSAGRLAPPRTTNWAELPWRRGRRWNTAPTTRLAEDGSPHRVSEQMTVNSFHEAVEPTTGIKQKHDSVGNSVSGALHEVAQAAQATGMAQHAERL